MMPMRAKEKRLIDNSPDKCPLDQRQFQVEKAAGVNQASFLASMPCPHSVRKWSHSGRLEHEHCCVVTRQGAVGLSFSRAGNGITRDSSRRNASSKSNSESIGSANSSSSSHVYRLRIGVGSRRNTKTAAMTPAMAPNG